MWDGIAYAQMGSVNHTDKLMNANMQYREYYLFPAGIALNLPQIETNAAADALPPWKQVAG